MVEIVSGSTSPDYSDHKYALKSSKYLALLIDNIFPEAKGPSPSSMSVPPVSMLGGNSLEVKILVRKISRTPTKDISSKVNRLKVRIPRVVLVVCSQLKNIFRPKSITQTY